MKFIIFIGYIGSISLGLSGTPQAIRVWEDGKAPGISLTFLILLLTGFASMITFVLGQIIIGKNLSLFPLLIGYSLNFTAYCIITYFKIFPRNNV